VPQGSRPWHELPTDLLRVAQNARLDGFVFAGLGHVLTLPENRKVGDERAFRRARDLDHSNVGSSRSRAMPRSAATLLIHSSLMRRVHRAWKSSMAARWVAKWRMAIG